jgi:hypothetical protein
MHSEDIWLKATSAPVAFPSGGIGIAPAGTLYHKATIAKMIFIKWTICPSLSPNRKT